VIEFGCESSNETKYRNIRSERNSWTDLSNVAKIGGWAGEDDRIETAGLALAVRATSRTERSQKMAYVITDTCDRCGTCKDSCPSEAIAEGEPIYVIDQENCIECGACVSECPNEAIVEQ
jgi:NAD-dependent dihydropyrimidine dehydrogenase PreA subunit